MGSSSKFNVGSLLLGSYVNMILFSLELVAAHEYFIRSKRSKRDRKFLKYTIAFDVFLDILGTFSACAVNVMAWFHISYHGNDVAVTKFYWPFLLWRVTNAMGAFIFQGFMLYRYWKLSQNRIVCIAAFLLMCSTIAAGLHVAAETKIHGPLSTHAGYFRQFIFALAGSVITDVLIAAGLIWELRRRNAFYTETQNIIAKICSLAIKTTLVTCIFALATLIAYIAYPLSRLATSFGFFLPRVYTLTMLYTLIYRDNLVLDPWIRVENAIESTDAHSAYNTTLILAAVETQVPGRVQCKPSSHSFVRRQVLFYPFHSSKQSDLSQHRLSRAQGSESSLLNDSNLLGGRSREPALPLEQTGRPKSRTLHLDQEFS
ncbi:hypothetical protein B0H34DRAFT_671914 [Crassisporium funariophilum]|nr:hypothetical protein B0H34DRAFT_671914 [Crassisporium funariophilum]